MDAYDRENAYLCTELTPPSPSGIIALSITTHAIAADIALEPSARLSLLLCLIPYHTSGPLSNRELQGRTGHFGHLFQKVISERLKSQECSKLLCPCTKRKMVHMVTLAETFVPVRATGKVSLTFRIMLSIEVVNCFISLFFVKRHHNCLMVTVISYFSTDYIANHRLSYLHKVRSNG
jgi:hypothetical protein